MNAREIVDSWRIPGVRLKDRWVGIPSVGRSQATSLMARGAVDRYVFGGPPVEVWLNVNLEAGTVELRSAVEMGPGGAVATLDHLPADFEDVVKWARMVVAIESGGSHGQH